VANWTVIWLPASPAPFGLHAGAHANVSIRRDSTMLAGVRHRSRYRVANSFGLALPAEPSYVALHNDGGRGGAAAFATHNGSLGRNSDRQDRSST